MVYTVEGTWRRNTYLIVTFCVGDAFLAVTPVGQRVYDIAYVPVFILELLQDLHSDREGLLRQGMIHVQLRDPFGV